MHRHPSDTKCTFLPAEKSEIIGTRNTMVNRSKRQVGVNCNDAVLDQSSNCMCFHEILTSVHMVSAPTANRGRPSPIAKKGLYLRVRGKWSITIVMYISR